MVDLFLPVLLENPVGNKDHSSHTRTCKHAPSPPTKQQELHADMRPAACPHTHMDTRCGQPCTIKEKWACLPGDFLQIQRGWREDKQRVGRKRFLKILYGTVSPPFWFSFSLVRRGEVVLMTCGCERDRSEKRDFFRVLITVWAWASFPRFYWFFFLLCSLMFPHEVQTHLLPERKPHYLEIFIKHLMINTWD